MTTTATRTDEYWVVEVIDPRDLENGLPGYRQRFTFYGEDAAQRAWVCQAAAENQDFKATSERVRGHEPRGSRGADPREQGDAGTDALQPDP